MLMPRHIRDYIFQFYRKTKKTMRSIMAFNGATPSFSLHKLKNVILKSTNNSFVLIKVSILYLLLK